MKGYYKVDLTHMEDAGSYERVSFWFVVVCFNNLINFINYMLQLHIIISQSVKKSNE